MGIIRILIAEDLPEWQEELHQILKRLGGSVLVDAALSYEVAINFLKKERYDLILVDLSLSDPPLDPLDATQQGMKLLQEIRNSSLNKDSAIIVLTAHGSIDLYRQALNKYKISDFREKGKFAAYPFENIASEGIRKARLIKAEFRHNNCCRMSITFNSSHVISCDLLGPGQATSHNPSDPVPFDVHDLIRRADRLDEDIFAGKAASWRPELLSIGKDIYKAVSAERRIQADLTTAQRLAPHPGDLALQFFGPVECLGVPFELMHNGDDYLSRDHVLTRRLVRSGPGISRKTTPFFAFIESLINNQELLRILIVGSNSDESIPSTEREAIALETSIGTDLKQLGIPYEIKLLLGENATHMNVSEALRDGRYHIFHYAGHGFYNNPLPETSGLVLYDGSMTADELNTLVHDTELRIVFLNCCQSARTSLHLNRGDFHGILAALAHANVPIVLGHRWSVLDDSADRLAQVFYERLWHTFSPGEALLEARRRAMLGPQRRDDETWASPILIMQSI